MSATDLHSIIRGLTSADVSLPRHQQALRAQLLAQHATQQTVRHRLLRVFKTITTGVPLQMKKTTFSACASALAITAVAVSVFSFTVMRSAPVGAAQLIRDATTKTQQMSSAEIAQFNASWHQDVTQRLAEAKNAKSLRMVSAHEINSWGGSIAKPGAPIATYVTYTDSNGHRVLIGLGRDEQPVLLYDVDASPDVSAPTPLVQIR